MKIDALEWFGSTDFSLWVSVNPPRPLALAKINIAEPHRLKSVLLKSVLLKSLPKRRCG